MLSFVFFYLVISLLIESSSLQQQPPASSSSAIAASSLSLCIDFNSFHFDIYPILNATTPPQLQNATTSTTDLKNPKTLGSSPSSATIEGIVKSVVNRSNCTSQYDDCQLCSNRFIEYLADSSRQRDAFHKAMVRMFIVATAPKMACEERKRLVHRRPTAATRNSTGKPVLGRLLLGRSVEDVHEHSPHLLQKRFSATSTIGLPIPLNSQRPAATRNRTEPRGRKPLKTEQPAGRYGLASMKLIVGPISEESIDRLFSKYTYLFRSPGSDDPNDERCFDVSRTMSVLRMFRGDDRYVQLAQMVTGFIYLNYSYPCRTPSKDIFLRQLFHSYGSDEYLTRSNLSRMANDLELYSVAADNDHGSEPRQKRDVSSAAKSACFNMDVILGMYDIHHNVETISWDEFVAISPALIHQKLKCTTPTPPEPEGKNDLTVAQKWGYGVAAVTIVSVSSVFGVFVFPLVKGTAYDATLHLFVAMAVASLIGDALLHLIPFYVGLDDEESQPSDSVEPVRVKPYFYKLLTAQMAIFFFYLFELFLRMLMPSSHERMEKGHEHEHEHELSYIEGTVNPSYGIDDGHLAVMLDNENHAHHPIDPHVTSSPGARRRHRRSKCCGLTAVTAMITLGDGLHNFADGMAIAAAFSSSGSFGLSTSVAILCHEIPHELGDMAVYLSTGMTIFNTAMLNLLASLTCFIGLFVGYGIAAQSALAREWILAVTSGFFLYVALTDLLPELVGPAEKNPKLILCHLIGFAIGAGIMILIAIFEEQIRL